MSKIRQMTYLTLQQAQALVDRYAEGNSSLSDVASAFGIANGTAGRIVHGKSRFERQGLDRHRLPPDRLEELRWKFVAGGRDRGSLTQQQKRRLSTLKGRVEAAQAAYTTFIDSLGISRTWANAVASRYDNGK
jgi:hypothetical protein